MFTATVTGEVTYIHPDAVVADADAMGDDILREAAKAERTQRVKSTERRWGVSVNQSHTARAWTGAGDVD